MEKSDVTAQWSATRGVSRRPLQIFAYDPMVDRFQMPIVARVPFELTQPGPIGRLVEVADVDLTRGTALPPLNLDDPDVLLNQGLACSETDPRSHQQMVYAVAMVVLEAFERGLGRPLVWEGEQRLRLLPHAQEIENVWFDPRTFSVLFGYFAAHSRSPGDNVPGQTVFSCLSYDMIAHEVAHPALFALRPTDLPVRDGQVNAFHEGMADLIAVLVRATSPQVVARAIRETGVDLSDCRQLFSVAMQFGEAADLGTAVRVYPEAADDQKYGGTTESHALGAILASAVLDAFLHLVRTENADLIGLHGPPRGDGKVHPDLVDRLAFENARLARETLRSLVAALDWLPPTNLTFGDYLRAFVTVDSILYGAAHLPLCAALIESFQKRAMLPEGIASLAADALAWPEVDESVQLRVPYAENALLFSERALEWRRRWASDIASASRLGEALREEARQRREVWLPDIAAWASDNAQQLGLSPGDVTAVAMNGAHQADADGNIRSSIFVQLVQAGKGAKKGGKGAKKGAKGAKQGGESAGPGEDAGRRGVTLVCGADGSVRHLIPPGTTKPAGPAWSGGSIPTGYAHLVKTLQG